MTVLLDQQAAVVVAHVVGDGVTTFMFPLHHIVCPYRTLGAWDKDEKEERNNDRDQFKLTIKIMYNI